MSLGPNDVLGMGVRGIVSSPSRVVMASPSTTGPTASTNTQIVTMPTVVLNNPAGQFEYIVDPVYGDKVVIKTAGMYKFRLNASTSGSPYFAVVKNLPNSLGATAANTNFAVAANKVFFLAYGRAAANLPLPCVTVSRLDPGDYVQFQLDPTGTYVAGDNCVDVEFLGG